MSEIPQLVDHLFRRQAGRMVSTLTSILGSKHIQLAEDVVQDSLVRALQLWPFQGVPQNPQAWLIQVAKNLALDRLRRDQSLVEKAPEIERRLNIQAQPEFDDQLAMMFLCCHPALPAAAQVALTLKIVAGFSVAEIARALLSREDAIAQRIVRAKRQIREERLAIEMPEDQHLVARLQLVMQAVYLIFNEGYSASQGPNLLRVDLCEEAIYLGGLLVQTASTALPPVHALMALMLFQAARLPARVDSSGDLLLLEDQDRALWDRNRIARAFDHLNRSAAGAQLTEYHLQAAIAAEHASLTTDWEHIVALYDQLADRNPSPVVLLNRAVAIANLQGPAAGIREVDLIPREALLNYYLLYATYGYLYQQAGNIGKASDCYRLALNCPCNEAERRFLTKRAEAASIQQVSYGYGADFRGP